MEILSSHARLYRSFEIQKFLLESILPLAMSKFFAPSRISDYTIVKYSNYIYSVTLFSLIVGFSYDFSVCLENPQSQHLLYISLVNCCDHL